MPMKPKPRVATSDCHAYENTMASVMLAIACESSDETMTTLGRRMGYRNRASLSHMASGLQPVPVGRAPDIARVVGLDEDEFTKAALWQRHGNVVPVIIGKPPIDEELAGTIRRRLLSGDVPFARRMMPVVSSDDVESALLGLIDQARAA